MYNIPMKGNANIVIGDESALFFHLHCDGPQQVGAKPVWGNPLEDCFTSAADLSGINASHPLYGGEPVSLLVPEVRFRRQTKHVKSRCCPVRLPERSFFMLRDNLFIASPELVFARMGNLVTEMQLAEIAINLCGRYYIKLGADSIEDRHSSLVTPALLASYLDKTSGMRGEGKARQALRWVLPNSGSPAETKMFLQYCTPLWRGGFAFPFTHMNYDVRAKRHVRMTEQSEFCIDLVNPDLHVAMEYDGGDSHQDSGKDNRRRNALKSLGWTVFVLDKAVLYNPEATIKAGLQIAKHMGRRLQFPSSWERNFAKLRKDLQLPI